MVTLAKVVEQLLQYHYRESILVSRCSMICIDESAANILDISMRQFIDIIINYLRISEYGLQTESIRDYSENSWYASSLLSICDICTMLTWDRCD